MTKEKTAEAGSVLIPIYLPEKVCVKRKYGKYPARYIYPRELINAETNLFNLIPRQ